MVPPREANDCCGLGGPLAGRPLDLTTSGRVDGFTCHSKTPVEPTWIVLSSVSVNVEPSKVGVSNVFFRRSTAPAGARPASTLWLVVAAVFSCAL